MIAYFDCFSGISGDMTLGAFIDLGVPVEWLSESLSKIPLDGFDLAVSSVAKNGISAKKVRVHVKKDTPIRNYAAIKALLQQSALPGRVRETSLKIFKKIAAAESVIHGCPIDEVHFHETGGIDAIVDITGTALCIEYLGIQNITASKIPVGTGFVSCQHGTLPIPAPATISILKDVPVYGTDIAHELVTPTGAAIITTLAKSFSAMPDMIVKKTGYGAGDRDLESRPNLLRIIIGNSPNDYKDKIVQVETCIDDMNPEVFGYLMDRLFEDGALDVYWIPIFMKKNRPATMVQVLCSENRRETIINRILSETTSLGVRYYNVQRRVLAREQLSIETTYGLIQVKQSRDSEGNIRIMPEYEVCKKIAIERNIPLQVVYDTVIREAADKI